MLEELAPGLPFEHRRVIRAVAAHISSVIGLVGGEGDGILVPASFSTLTERPSPSALLRLPRLTVSQRSVDDKKSFGHVYRADVLRVPYVNPNSPHVALLRELGFNMISGSHIFEIRF